MADKVSFTDFRDRKKVRKVKRSKPKEWNVDVKELLDEVLTARKMADKAIEESSSSRIHFHFWNSRSCKKLHLNRLNGILWKSL